MTVSVLCGALFASHGFRCALPPGHAGAHFAWLPNDCVQALPTPEGLQRSLDAVAHEMQGWPQWKRDAASRDEHFSLTRTVAAPPEQGGAKPPGRPELCEACRSDDPDGPDVCANKACCCDQQAAYDAGLAARDAQVAELEKSHSNWARAARDHYVAMEREREARQQAEERASRAEAAAKGWEDKARAARRREETAEGRADRAEARMETLEGLRAFAVNTNRQWRDMVCALLDREQWNSAPSADLELGALMLSLRQWFDARPDLAATLEAEREAHKADLERIEELCRAVDAAFAAHGVTDDGCIVQMTAKQWDAIVQASVAARAALKTGEGAAPRFRRHARQAVRDQGRSGLVPVRTLHRGPRTGGTEDGR